MSIKAENATCLRNILAETPAIPKTCQWVTFLRNHDELTLEMVTPDERRWMWEQYAPHPRMRINLGIRRRLAQLVCVVSREEIGEDRGQRRADRDGSETGEREWTEGRK